MPKLSWNIARAYIAGDNRETALGIAREWNQRGASVILNFLGEHLREESVVLATLAEYLVLIHRMRSDRVRGSVAIKPSQLGLELGRENFAQNLHRLLKVAKNADIFVWIDMEQPRSVSPTLEVFRDVLRDFGTNHIGVCLQANLRRTPQDLEEMIDRGAYIRLVKGVYHGEPADILLPGSLVEDVFRELMERMFETSFRFALGTHDPVLIEESLALNQKWNREVEWEMLMGVAIERQMDLLTSRLPFGVYIPYGREWKPYVRRRLMQR